MLQVWEPELLAPVSGACISGLRPMHVGQHQLVLVYTKFILQRRRCAGAWCA